MTDFRPGNWDELLAMEKMMTKQEKKVKNVRVEISGSVQILL